MMRQSIQRRSPSRLAAERYPKWPPERGQVQIDVGRKLQILKNVHGDQGVVGGRHNQGRLGDSTEQGFAAGQTE